MIKAEIVADSINPQGCRLTTFVLEYPRFIHSELLTHRVFSKNAASSRAIPIEKMIEAVQTNPAMPVWWGANQSGMQAKEELDDVNKSCMTESYSGRYSRYIEGGRVTPRELAKSMWLEARDDAIKHVQGLMFVGLHKQIANRILEPWFHIRIILSGTEYENFFALRAHPDAQPELQALAYKMLEAYNASKPKQLAVGQWHIPFGDQIEMPRLMDVLSQGIALEKADHIDFNDPQSVLRALGMKIAIARCARISYLNYEGKDDYAADIKLCDRLFGASPKHLSPTEHVARCEDHRDFVGNYRGFTQYRKTFVDESLSDPRVIKPSL